MATSQVPGSTTPWSTAVVEPETSRSCTPGDDKSPERLEVPDRGYSSSAASLSGSETVYDKAEGPASNTVTWNSPSDPANPKNWSKRRKWATSLIISSFAFLSPLSSSIMAPALTSIGDELHVPAGVQQQLVLSIFLLAFALGPFVLSPCSEVWGRTAVIRFGNLVFILFTGLCGFAESQAQITAFRFLAGVGGSASVGMGSGVLADCWRSEERGKGLAVYQFLATIGPAVGPIMGGYIAESTTWRWCFWAVVIMNVVVQVIAAFCLRETYGPRLLQLKARALRAATGNPLLRTEWEQSESDRSLPGLLRVALSRPWIMLGTQPIIVILALYQAFNFGTLYLLISGFPALWEGRYGMPRGDASLNYLSLAIGSLIGANICGPATDYVYAWLKRREGIPDDKPGRPEMRMPLMVPASIITPFALALYGWSAEAKLHFIVPNLGAAIFAGSSMICYQCISAYIADAYTLHSASASAACAFLRSMCGFLFPLFVPALFGNLGYGWGGSVIAGAAVAMGIPAPWIMMTFGQRLRKSSRFTPTVVVDEEGGSRVGKEVIEKDRSR